MTADLADTKHVAFVHSNISPDDFSDSMKLVQDFHKPMQKKIRRLHLPLCLCFTRHSKLRMPHMSIKSNQQRGPFLVKCIVSINMDDVDSITVVYSLYIKQHYCVPNNQVLTVLADS